MWEEFYRSVYRSRRIEGEIARTWPTECSYVRIVSMPAIPNNRTGSKIRGSTSLTTEESGDGS